jgi:hypothetical protein
MPPLEAIAESFRVCWHNARAIAGFALIFCILPIYLFVAFSLSQWLGYVLLYFFGTLALPLFVAGAWCSFRTLYQQEQSILKIPAKICAKCGAEYSIWLKRSDGLCRLCGLRADEIVASQKAQQNAVEQSPEIPECCREDIEAILKAMTKETPLTYTFVNWGIQEIHKDAVKGTLRKLPGLIAGVAIGGPIGEMIFGGTLLSKTGTYEYSGALGILVVTHSDILIAHCASQFIGSGGGIVPEHLKLLRAQLESNPFSCKAYPIQHTRISCTNTSINLVYETESLSFAKSELYAENAVVKLPSVTDVQKRVIGLGMLATPELFTARLLRGESPITAIQFDEAKKKTENYLAAIFQDIIKHGYRDKLIQQFSCLVPPLRAELETRIREKGESVGAVKTSLYIWVAIAFFSTIAMFNTRDVMAALSGLAALITVIGSLRAVVDLYRCKWCQEISQDVLG